MKIRYLAFIIIYFIINSVNATAQAWQDFMGPNLTAEQREAGEKFIQEISKAHEKGEVQFFGEGTNCNISQTSCVCSGLCLKDSKKFKNSFCP